MRRCPQRSRVSVLGVVMVGVVVLTLLAACAGAPGPNNVAHVATGHVSGFWPGLWHGVISPITLIVSLFNNDVNIYDVHNNGNWYNVGFMIGVTVLLGGGHASGRSR